MKDVVNLKHAVLLSFECFAEIQPAICQWASRGAVFKERSCHVTMIPGNVNKCKNPPHKFEANSICCHPI